MDKTTESQNSRSLQAGENQSFGGLDEPPLVAPVAVPFGETGKELEQVTNTIAALVMAWEPRLAAIDTEVLEGRRNGQNRTIKQILGHLIDSASNNLHRIVHLQYRESPLQFPDYANLGINDRWIALQNYQAEEWPLLVQHWKFSNLHLAHVIGHIDGAALGNIWVSALGESVSLLDMAVDYPRHFALHLREIEVLLHPGGQGQADNCREGQSFCRSATGQVQY